MFSEKIFLILAFKPFHFILDSERNHRLLTIELVFVVFCPSETVFCLKSYIEMTQDVICVLLFEYYYVTVDRVMGHSFFSPGPTWFYQMQFSMQGQRLALMPHKKAKRSLVQSPIQNWGLSVCVWGLHYFLVLMCFLWVLWIPPTDQ